MQNQFILQPSKAGERVCPTHYLHAVMQPSLHRATKTTGPKAECVAGKNTSNFITHSAQTLYKYLRNVSLLVFQLLQSYTDRLLLTQVEAFWPQGPAPIPHPARTSLQVAATRASRADLEP